ncbi:MAG TPA: carboxy terminal-processing peptidase, partial [Chitinophagaceae bacterium]|nr:carboxy terminal-processing peptidase [Chitinophagaceae bacterium]
VGSNPIGYPNNGNLLYSEGFFIFILSTIHQKALLKGITCKKNRVFALFLRRMLKLINYMTNLKRLPILIILLLVAGVFFAGSVKKESDPPGKYEKILHNVTDMLKEAHYSPKHIDDSFSKKIFHKYFEVLDPNKNIFLREDIESLRKFELRIDDEMKGADVEFFKAVGQIFNKRMEEAAAMYKDVLSKPFNYSIDETFAGDPDKIKFPVSNADKKESWRKWLKYQSLDRYVELIETRDKNKDRADFKVKSNEELEVESREKVSKVMERTFERYRFKFSEDDKFNLFVSIITNTMDPHTEFFPPVDKRYFDEQMSGRFFGIGASLLYDEGNIKINTLVAGSPAWKSGEVQVGDVILKVGQGKEEPTELTGFVVEDAVKLIRGKKGTEVRLTLKKQDGSVKVVTLVRDEIVQDESFARSAIIKNGNSRLGYIYLPEFYADFDRPNGARCYIDVAKEIIKLKEDKVDGIIMDLRNNGGGSLYDVVQMVGLFIEKGPIVQVKDRDGKPNILEDKNREVLYDGPLTVMVNEFSASASEIFAAAIQDYGRGVVIGSTSTYGKGTVQRNLGLDPESGYLNSNSDLGTIKLTLQKFYRVNGGSTQLKGVVSDIILPDNYEYLKFREKDEPDALPWDEIKKATINNWRSGYELSTIQRLSDARLQTNEAFKLIKENTEWLAKQNDREYSLNFEKYQKEQKAIRATVRQIELLKKLQGEMDVSSLPQDANRFSYDKGKQDRFDQWIKNLRKDIYIDQAAKVTADMVVQKNLVQNKTEEVKKPF